MSRGEQIRAELAEQMRQRILLLDGAMGTMIQARRLTEADYRGREFAAARQGSAPQQRSAESLPAADHRGGASRLSGRRRRHHRDQHVQRQRHLHGRVRPGESRGRPEPAPARKSRAALWTASPPRPDAAATWPARWGRRRAPRRCRRTSAIPQRAAVTFDQLREAYCRAGPGPGRGRRGPAAAGDGLRHAECQGRAVRHRGILREERRPHPGDRLGHRSWTAAGATSPDKPWKPSGFRSRTCRCWAWA